MDTIELYNDWLENLRIRKRGCLFDASGVLSDDLLKGKDDKNDINDRFYKELEFGTAGLRGVLGAGTNRMNIFTVGKATLGIANYLKKAITDRQPVVAISFDSRHMSKEFAMIAASIFNKAGIVTYAFDRLQPTPVLSYSVRYLKADAGIMITASHNPAKYNGYKVYGSDGAQLMPEICDLVLEEIAKIDSFFTIPVMTKKTAVKLGLFREMPEDLLKTYYNLVESTIIDRNVLNENKSKIKIVYTPLFGCGNEPVCEMLTRLGFDFTIVKEQQKPNGDFPGLKNPNPEFAEAFDIAKVYGEKLGATLLVATDPDSDRIGIMSKYNGEYHTLTGNQVGALLLDYILMARKANGSLKNNAAYVKTIVTSVLCDKIGDAYGVETVNVLTGFKFIADKIQQFESEGRQFILGFEESYGYLTGSFVRDKDAVIASVIICEMAAYYASKNMTVYEGLLALYEKYGYSMESVSSFYFEGMEGMQTMKKIMDAFRNARPDTLGGGKVTEFDDYLLSYSYKRGSKEKTPIDLPKSNVLAFRMDNDTTVLMRPSGTEPKVKFYFFSADHDRELAAKNMKALTDEVFALMDKFKAE